MKNGELGIGQMNQNTESKNNLQKTKKKINAYLKYEHNPRQMAARFPRHNRR